MPELPEVEAVVRSLRREVVGAKVTRASLHHDGMLTAGIPAVGIGARARRASAHLLHDGVIAAVHRHGKSFALEVEDGRALVIHLGMSGRFLLDATTLPTHAHARWHLRCRTTERSLLFVDPRRFGSLRSLGSIGEVREGLWTKLGPDALAVDAAAVRKACHRSGRPIKSLLLDQNRLAGIGNIYADEILHLARIHPLTPASTLEPMADHLAAVIRSVLARAIELGGSTIRDYVDPGGNFGSFQSEHRVYGRTGLRCPGRPGHACDAMIETIRLGGRSTSFCPRCQPLRTSPARGGPRKLRPS